jgi:RNA polymerase sigma-70 factor (ECF subfamily)
VLPWLYGIATNLLRRHRRGEVRQLRALGRSGVDRGTHEDAVAVRDARLARALAAMRPNERDALLLYALADLSYDEIATALEVPVGTVRTWLHRARAIAKRELSVDPVPFATSGADLRG